jgi:hypothetical protein
LLRLSATTLAIAPFLFACTEPAPPPAEAVPDAPGPHTVRAPEREIAPAPPPPPTIERDPYESYLSVVDRHDEGAPRTKLETIPLDRLRVVGVVQQTAPVALLEDDSGEGHMVRIGTRVGTAGGLVTAITRKDIVVEEHFRDPLMRTIKVEKRLPLAAASG